VKFSLTHPIISHSPNQSRFCASLCPCTCRPRCDMRPIKNRNSTAAYISGPIKPSTKIAWPRRTIQSNALSQRATAIRGVGKNQWEWEQRKKQHQEAIARKKPKSPQFPARPCLSSAHAKNHDKAREPGKRGRHLGQRIAFLKLPPAGAIGARRRRLLLLRFL
jgi:hypothetical protein